MAGHARTRQNLVSNPDIYTTVSIVLTIAAIVAAFRVHSASPTNRNVWLGLSVAALASLWFSDILSLIGILSLVGFGALAWFVRHSNTQLGRRLGHCALVVLSLALALHWMPGINNPRLIDPLLLSLDTRPFQLYANFDKAWVGLVLVALLYQRALSVPSWKAGVMTTVAIGTITIIVTLTSAVAAGVVRFDPKLPEFTLVVLATHFFFTVIPEEAFFRLLIQEPLSRRLTSVRFGAMYAVVITAGLFALAHFGGGLQYMILAGVAGLGYALVYAYTKRLSAAIATHFGLNMVHFFFFSYPQLASAP